MATATAPFLLGRYEEAAVCVAQASRGPNPPYWSDALHLAIVTKLGRKAEAASAKAALLERKPDFRISTTTRFWAFHREEFHAALREAGLRE